MDAREAYAYALLRIVPDAARGEAVNAGIVFYCRRDQFLEIRWELPIAALAVVAPEIELDPLRANLAALQRIAAGDRDAGPVAAQDQSERFHWLVAPSSTLVQPGPVHTGLTAEPAATLTHLFSELVLP
ncbi:MAG TPA: DUF3037 domain-containing protein [Baekduia sp.]|nr:DUF3037 domain-containing protein [Baekduia sp.]